MPASLTVGTMRNGEQINRINMSVGLGASKMSFSSRMRRSLQPSSSRAAFAWCAAEMAQLVRNSHRRARPHHQQLSPANVIGGEIENEGCRPGARR